jgi:hypothetical protein
VKASGGSGGQIVFSIDPATSHAGTPQAACSIQGATVTFDHAGTCVIAAEESSGTSALARSAAKAATTTKAIQSIEVPQTAQTVSFQSTQPSSPAVDGSYTVAATSSSGRDVSISIDPATTNNACSASGAVVSFDHVGTCVVTATQDGDADLASASATQSMDVGKGAQAIDIEPAAPSTGHVGDSYEFTTTGGRSGNPVVIDTTNHDVCSYADGKVWFLTSGKCVITADQAESGDYFAAPTVTQSVNVVPLVEDVDLGVVGTKSHDIGGLSGVTATVTGSLPDGATATLTATATGNADFRPVTEGVSCKSADSDGSKAWTCTITADDLANGSFDVVFAVNTQHGRDVTFEIQPDKPYVDDEQGDNKTVPPVHWDD